MFRPQTALVTIVACVLSGCATTAPRDPLVARQRSYERLASFLEPGMTRRQLYALLPPQRPARTGSVDVPGSSIFGLMGPSGFQSEYYPLDPDFVLHASFILAKAPTVSRSGPLIINATAIDLHLDARGPASPRDSKRAAPKTQRSGKVCISAKAIDDLLFGRADRRLRSVRSKEDLDDRLFDRPLVTRVQQRTTP